MKLTIAQLGTASKVTRDWTGAWAWDQIVYDYRKHKPYG